MQVPLIDLVAQYQSLKPEIDEAITRVLSKGQYVIGEEVEKFESEWAAYCKAKYCVAVSSGTDALYLALQSYKLLEAKGHWVAYVPVRTFIATAEAAVHAGYEVRLFDGAIPQPNAFYHVVMPVHLYGAPTPFYMPTFQLHKVVEDAAQSHGQPLRGDVACHSFYPTKNLGAVGQAGAVVTNDSDLSGQVRVLRAHGELERFNSYYLSGNYRMDELQAAILRVKLPHLAAWNKRRREIAHLYSRELSYLEGIKLPPDHTKHVYHIYAIETPKRNELAKHLEGKGIQTAVRYPVPLHLQPALRHLGYKEGDFPDAERWARETLSLPIYAELEDSAVEYVCKSIREWADKCV